MPLALSRDPGPTPSVGHVTGDVKRRESNETRTGNYINGPRGDVHVSQSIARARGELK